MGWIVFVGDGADLRSGDGPNELSKIVISLQGGITANGAIVSIQHPIKANPVKTGDAKLWVYRRENGNDCQATEDHKVSVFVFIPPGLSKSGIFYRKMRVVSVGPSVSNGRP
jgi:hypothetical protein